MKKIYLLILLALTNLSIATNIPIEKAKTENIVVKTQITKENKKNSNSVHGKEYFKLISATSESWTAGIAGGGSGTEYYFKIKINTSNKILFDTAWINNKAFSIYISKKTSGVSSQPIKYVNGDTIVLRVSDIHSANAQNKNTINNKPPITFNGAALIGYTNAGKREYFTIKEIKKQKSPNRP